MLRRSFSVSVFLGFHTSAMDEHLDNQGLVLRHCVEIQSLLTGEIREVRAEGGNVGLWKGTR